MPGAQQGICRNNGTVSPDFVFVGSIFLMTESSDYLLRPAVSLVPPHRREQLRRMIQAKEDFHLIDVMGEQHWRAGHLPGAEWLEFRNLSREARRRYGKDDALVVYCNDYT